jgi:hypothetical protein
MTDARNDTNTLFHSQSQNFTSFQTNKDLTVDNSNVLNHYKGYPIMDTYVPQNIYGRKSSLNNSQVKNFYDI